MAAVPQQEPAKPAKRARARWNVYLSTENDVVLKFVGCYEARNADAANWQAAEGKVRDEAMSENPPKLVAFRRSEVEPKTYRLRSTVERVKA